MRKEVLSILCSLVCSGLLGATVRVEMPRKTLVSTSRVREICIRVDTACTTFVRTEFSCTCRRTSAGWSPVVEINSMPLMVTSHDIYYQHEREHVFDFDLAMHSHAEDIEANSFASPELCEEFAADQRAAFPSFIRDVVRQSMLYRDRAAAISQQSPAPPLH